MELKIPNVVFQVKRKLLNCKHVCANDLWFIEYAKQKRKKFMEGVRDWWEGGIWWMPL